MNATGTRPAPCAEHEVALSLLAAGALDGDEAARLEAHVQGCAPCRAVLALSRRALGLAALPPVSEEERRAVSPLAARLRAELARRDRRRSLWSRTAVLAAVAAALVAAVASPIYLQKSAERRAHERALLEERIAELEAAAEERAGWEPPDLDALYADTEAVLDDSPRTARGTFIEAALSSYDAGVGY